MLKNQLRRYATTGVSFGTIAGLLLVFSPPASADLCEVNVDGKVSWVDCDTLGGNNGDDGDEFIENGGGGDLPCVLKPGDNTCVNGESCLVNEPALNEEDFLITADLLPPKPGPDWFPAYSDCNGGSEWYWTQIDEPSIEELALTALGSLPFPDFSAEYNPPNRTLIGLPTWWWVDGPTAEPLSASAGSITVTATPSVMEVDPGDGSGIMSCAFQTSQGDACSYQYRRANSDGYDARVRLVWTLEFVDSEDPIDVPGLPTTFTSPWQEANVPVLEIQTVVRGVR